MTASSRDVARTRRASVRSRRSEEPLAAVKTRVGMACAARGSDTLKPYLFRRVSLLQRRDSLRLVSDDGLNAPTSARCFVANACRDEKRDDAFFL